MAHSHHPQAKRTMGDKLYRMVGKRGDYPADRAARIANVGANQPAQGDAAAPPQGPETPVGEE